MQRRAVTVPAVALAAVALVLFAPLWLPLSLLADLVRGRFRLPTARLLAFAMCWAWLESMGVAAAAGLWLTGQRRNQRAHFALQRWWAARLMGALRATTGMRVEAVDAGCLAPGPAVMLCRHASLADSLLSAWIITGHAGMNPRYVLKRELLYDPCLDIVGNRLPNHFLDRQATDTAPELAALRELATGLRANEIAVIFPEGTRSSPAKRQRAIDAIRERDPGRADRLAPLRHLLPPRPAGAEALLDGCPTADVVVAWHVGFDGLDTFGGIIRHLSRRPLPVRFHAERVARAELPCGGEFRTWLDDVWLRMDRSVDELLHLEGSS